MQARVPPPRVNFSFDDSVTIINEPHFLIPQDSGADFEPGDTNKTVDYAFYTGTVWQKDVSNLSVKLHDPRNLCMALKGEVVAASWSDQRQQWEVEIPHGLHRKAVVKEVGGITAGGSGACEIYTNGTASGVQVDVDLKWMDGGKDVAIDKEVYIHYDSNEKKWWMPGAECP